MSSGRAPIPLSLPFLDEREHELVNEVLDSGRLSLGPTGRRFEQMLIDEGALVLKFWMHLSKEVQKSG